MKKLICGVSLPILIAVLMLLTVPGEAGAFAGGDGVGVKSLPDRNAGTIGYRGRRAPRLVMADS